MSFNNDEPTAASQDDSGEKSVAFPAGKVKVSFFRNPTAPLEASKFKVMLELTGAGSGKHRFGLDLVTVLDVSGSMGDKTGEKLKKMKIAMVFIIKKLSPSDRLSIVTFNEGSKELCSLRHVTENSREEIETMVNALVAGGTTNIYAGLKTALEVVNGHKLPSGRAGGIILMSDGGQNEFEGSDAAKVQADVPVHTFGFGADQEPTVLKDIADNSMGGTFSDVRNQDNLSIAFSQCLAGLLTVTVRDLKLTVRKGDSTIENVSAGNYEQSKNVADGSVTVSFGDLYIKEVRKVIVEVLLGVADSSVDGHALEFTYTYRTGRTLFDARPRTVLVRRTSRTYVEQEVEEVVIEENRLRTTKMINAASVMANNNERKDAHDHLVDAQNLLDDVVYDEPNRLIEMLKYELQQMKSMLESDEIYKNQGRPFALSSETSHNRQRFATRGDDVENLRLFATPRMNAYLEQAKSFDEHPNKPPPSVDEDVKQELAADPLAPIDGALSYHTQTAIQSLKSIDNILNKAKSQTSEQELAANPHGSIVGDLRYHTNLASQSLKSIEDILNQAGRA